MTRFNRDTYIASANRRNKCQCCPEKSKGKKKSSVGITFNSSNGRKVVSVPVETVTFDAPAMTTLLSDAGDGLTKTDIIEINLPNVTTLGGSPFQNCTSLISVCLENATSIANSAFKGCSSLREVNLPKLSTLQDKVFEDCTFLSTVSVPEVTEIRKNTFSGCAFMTKFSGPKVTTITADGTGTGPGKGPFVGCVSLREIDLPELTDLTLFTLHISSAVLTTVCIPKVGTIPDGCFDGLVNLISVDASSATTLGEECFKNCYSLTSVDTRMVNTLDVACFENCHSLKKADFPLMGDTNIGESTFKNCWGLLNINFPEFEGDIGDEAFRNCILLKKAEFPSRTDASDIGTDAFTGCHSLETIVA